MVGKWIVVHCQTILIYFLDMSMNMSENIREKVYCNPDTGAIICKVTNQEKSYFTKRGYLYIKLGKKQLRVNRVVWMLERGDIPKDMMVDHINGIKTDNRLSNLRLVTAEENAQNVIKKRPKHNLPPGVKEMTDRKNKRFYVSVSVKGKRMSLGYFETEVEAGQAYIDGKIKYHSHANPERLQRELNDWKFEERRVSPNK